MKIWTLFGISVGRKVPDAAVIKEYDSECSMENGFWEKETHSNKKSWKTFMMVQTEIMKFNL